MPRNKSEKTLEPAHQAMLDCFNALHAWVCHMEERGTGPANANPTSLHLQTDYLDAYQKMTRVAKHRIGGNRNTYAMMRDTLAREIEARFGTKPQ